MTIIKDLYAVLEIKKDASQTDIKKAYHKLARIYHPDKNPKGEEKFKEIKSAYETLINENSRIVYNVEQQSQNQKFQSTSTFTNHNTANNAESSKSTPSSKSSNNNGTKQSNNKFSSKNQSSNESKHQGSSPRYSFFDNTTHTKTKPQWDDSFSYPDSKSKRKYNTNTSYKPYTDSHKWRDTFRHHFDHVDTENDASDYSSDSSDSIYEDPSEERVFNEYFAYHNQGQPHESGGAFNQFQFWFDEDGRVRTDTPLYTPFPEENKKQKEDAFVRCKYCRISMNVEELVDHEPQCLHKPRTMSPQAPWNSGGDEDILDDPVWEHLDKRWRDWRDVHAKTQESIRRDKQRVAPKFSGETARNGLFRCPLCLQTFNESFIAQHVLSCRASSATASNSNSNNSQYSKTTKAKEYAKNIRRPSMSSTKPQYPPTQEKTDEQHLPNINKDKSKTQRPSSKSSSSQKNKSKLDASFSTHLKGSGFSSSNGCQACQRKYGPNAKFNCSCAFKTSKA